MQEDKAALVREAFPRILSGDPAAVDQYIASDCVRHDPDGRDVRGRHGAKLFIAALRRAFPDLTANVEDVIAEGDKVVLRYTATATHAGEYLGIAPTGRKVTYSGINIYRVRGGQIREAWQLTDWLSLMEQLGVTVSVG